MSADKIRKQIVFLQSLGPGDEKYDEIVDAFTSQGEADADECAKRAIQDVVREMTMNALYVLTLLSECCFADIAMAS